MKNYFLWPMATLLLCSEMYAQQEQDSMNIMALDEVVVSDTRFALKRENSGKTVLTITQQELERNQGRSIADIINAKSGIEINGTRSFAGQNLSTFVRGGNNRQVLVIIDGIQVSDPSNPDAEYDLRLLNTAQIERIEILKGAASTLYGNSAATAVINITTKSATSEGLTLDALSSLGTNMPQNDQNYNISDFSNSVSLAAKQGKLSLLVSGGHVFTDGLSAAIGTEPDAFSQIDGNVKIGYEVTKRFRVNASAFYTKLNSDYDNGFPIADADFNFSSEQSRFALSGSYTYEKGSMNVNAAFNQIDRFFDSDFSGAFNSQSFVLDVFDKHTFNEHFYAIAGLNFIEGRTLFEVERTTSTVDPYINLVYIGEGGINVNAGVRLNNHNTYGSTVVYNLNPSYRIKTEAGYVKVLASYATSFIAPNLSQLYGPFGANPDLNPEDNRTLEGGFEYKLSNAFSINALYFNRQENNRIRYSIIDADTFEGLYQNTDETERFDGVEVGITSLPFTDLSVTANYTLTSAKEGLALRVPRSKVNANLGYDVNQSTFVGCSYQYVSDRNDIDFSDSSAVTLASFSLMNIQVRHQFSEKLTAFVMMDNVFNEDYLELVDFTTKGRNMRLGFRLSL